MNQNTQGYNPGLFDFQKMMNDFYSYGAKDEDGNIDKEAAMVKNAMQANFLQSAIDGQIAAGLAQQNSAIAMDNMSHQANLELANTQDLMQREFAFNQLAQESTFKYESDFANAQYDRDIGMLTATGEQNRMNMQEQGQQDRLGEIVAGEQERLTSALNNASAEAIASGRYGADKYTSDRQLEGTKFTAAARQAADMYGSDKSLESTKYSSDATKDVGLRQAEASENVAGTQKEAATEVAATKAGADVESSRLAAEASKYGADRTLEGTKDTNITSTRNIGETGKQTRETMGLENRLKAKDRADMHRYARSTARAM